jgi:hypothetical protein
VIFVYRTEQGQIRGLRYVGHRSGKGGLPQIGPFALQKLFETIADVLDYVKPIRHLQGVGCAVPGAIRIRTAAITADDVYARMRCEPRRKRRRSAVG